MLWNALARICLTVVVVVFMVFSILPVGLVFLNCENHNTIRHNVNTINKDFLIFPRAHYLQKNTATQFPQWLTNKGLFVARGSVVRASRGRLGQSGIPRRDAVPSQSAASAIGWSARLSHLPLGHVAASEIFALDAMLDSLFFEHPQAPQCPTCSGWSIETWKCLHEKHMLSRWACNASLAGTSNALLAIARIKVTARSNNAGGVASLIFALYSSVNRCTYSDSVSPSNFSLNWFVFVGCGFDDTCEGSRIIFNACVFNLGSLMVK